MADVEGKGDPDAWGGEGGPDVSEGGGAIAAPAPMLFRLSPSGSSSSSPGLLLNPEKLLDP